MTPEELESLPGYQKFRSLLDELFQFEHADLDFGIYRVLARRRREIDKYFREELPRRLAAYLTGVEAASRADLDARILEIRQTLSRSAPKALTEDGDLSADAEQIAEVVGGETAELIRQYRTLTQERKNFQLADAQVNDVLLLLYDFFARYYEEGDFIPQPRFAGGKTYALESYRDALYTPRADEFPGEDYRGEEVYFHWPTRGMHYVKTDTYLKNYSFRVTTEGLGQREYAVRFILDQVENVPDNNKVKRFFFPKPDGVCLKGDVLVIPLDYRRRRKDEPSTQRKIFEEAMDALLNQIPDYELRHTLQSGLLLKRLQHYAALGSRDFFIHRQLYTFLTSELEYFVKSKALRLAEIENESALRQRLAVVNAFRLMALDVIRFLDQLETIQAKLFEKKRLVYRADYIVPIRFVPRDLWPEILSNVEQLNSWRRDLGLEGDITEKPLKRIQACPFIPDIFPSPLSGDCCSGFQNSLLRLDMKFRQVWMS